MFSVGNLQLSVKKVQLLSFLYLVDDATENGASCALKL